MLEHLGVEQDYGCPTRTRTRTPTLALALALALGFSPCPNPHPNPNLSRTTAAAPSPTYRGASRVTPRCCLPACSPACLGVGAATHRAAASLAYGCSLSRVRLQPPPHAYTYGCRCCAPSRASRRAASSASRRRLPRA
eukprot:scaffold38234_cov36-Phaeocystis_antarctica.AAC.2